MAFIKRILVTFVMLYSLFKTWIIKSKLLKLELKLKLQLK